MIPMEHGHMLIKSAQHSYYVEAGIIITYTSYVTVLKYIFTLPVDM